MTRPHEKGSDFEFRYLSRPSSFMTSFIRFVLVIATCACVVSLTHAQTATEDTSATIEAEQTDDQAQSVDQQPNFSDEDGPDTNELVSETHEIFPDQIMLDEIRLYIDQGMIQLAYSTLQRVRTEYELSDDWVEWERVFFEVARILEDWEGILERSKEIAETVPYEFYSDMQTHSVYASLKLGQVEIAKERLRNLIWEFPYDQSKMIQWRELMIQCYLTAGMLEDARIAMSAYNRDYRPSTPKWEHRYARVLFVTDHQQEASSRVASLQTTESKLLILYSDYLSGVRTPLQVVQAGLEMASEFANHPELELELWALVELAARDMNDLEIQVTAIENGLSVGYDVESKNSRVWVVTPVTESLLLATYADLAVTVGNDFNLVVGDDASWFGLAQEFDITAPVVARAIYSFIGRRTSNTDVYNASVYALAENLNSDGLNILMDLLFVRNGHFDFSATSSSIRTKLANRSLRRKDYLTALRIMDSIEESDEPDKVLVQLMRKARVAVAVKEYGMAFQLIERMIENLSPDVEQRTIDRVIQVIFDVQNSGTHEFAISLFRKLYLKIPEIQTRREILRWISESLSAQSKNIEASEMLLRSARMGDKWDDNWGKSARLEAADELTISGLYDDARILYEELRKSSLDPRSKALISNRLKNLPD